MSANPQRPDPWDSDEAESGEGPRAPSLTLVGVGPASGAVVVGAVARPASVPPPVPTDRNLFDAIQHTAAEDEADEKALSTPPALAQGPALAPAYRPAPREEPRPLTVRVVRAPQARAGRASPLVWAPVLVVAVGSMTAVAWRAHLARSQSAPPAVVATPVAAAPLPPTVPAALAAPAPEKPVAAPAPVPVAAPASPAPVTTALPPFDAEAAESALADTAKTVARCRYGAVYGKGQASVTFGADGAVTECSLSGRFRWTQTGACLRAVFTAVHVAPFSGVPETVVHPFEVAPR